MTDAIELGWLFSRLIRGRGKDFLKSADRSYELAPGENRSSQPAIFPDGDLDKVIEIAPWRYWKIEEALMYGASMSHGATIAYEFSDVSISGAYLYKGKLREQYGACERHLRGTYAKDWQELSHACLVTCKTGSEYFGHFMWDNLPMELIPSPDQNPITLPALPRWHEDGYRKVFDLPTPPLLKYGRVQSLTLYSDTGQNPYREARYRQLQERARHSFGEPQLPKNPGVFVRRGSNGECRELVNEPEIIRIFESRGFTIIDPDNMAEEEIFRLAVGARMIAGIDGSHIAHAMYFMADEGTFLIIQPPTRFSMVYKEFTDRLDLSYAFLVGDPVDDGFLVDPDKLERLLDRL